MIENLNFIREKGMTRFIKREIKKYKCQKCGELKSTHNNKCPACEKFTSLK